MEQKSLGTEGNVPLAIETFTPGKFPPALSLLRHKKSRGLIPRPKTTKGRCREEQHHNDVWDVR
jgi:hypothetical protein